MLIKLINDNVRVIGFLFLFEVITCDIRHEKNIEFDATGGCFVIRILYEYAHEYA